MIQIKLLSIKFIYTTKNLDAVNQEVQVSVLFSYQTNDSSQFHHFQPLGMLEYFSVKFKAR